MDVTDFVKHYPNLYHVTAIKNWEGIQRHGLLSTSMLLDRFEVDDERRHKVERERRVDFAVLNHPEHGMAVIRDNRPLIESKLRACLEDGLTPQDWYAILNRRVFFWPTLDRVKTLLGAAAYRTTPQLVIKVDTERLVKLYGDCIELSPMNSGATRPFAHPRGLSTFTSMEAYDFDARRKKSGLKNAIVEVAILDAVDNLVDVATSATRYDPNGPPRVTWRR